MTLARYLASGVTAVLDVGGPFWTFEARECSKRMPYAPQVAVNGTLDFKPYAFAIARRGPADPRGQSAERVPRCGGCWRRAH